VNTQREQDGWLPDPVQQIANAAARCGLVPLVEIRLPGSISLRDEHDDEIATVAMLGPTVYAYVNTHEEDADEDVLVEAAGVTLLGAERILAWITRKTGRYAGHAR
jgi:hypothetical protein